MTSSIVTSAPLLDVATAAPLRILILFSVLAILPGIVISMTAFLRIVLVLGFTRNAIGLQQMPPNQVIIGFSLFDTPDDVPLRVILPAFVVSELRTAFAIGFLLFVPFLVIDLSIAALLNALGMIMLPPTMVALPFKLLLFVLADGWSLLVGALVKSFAG
jgi:flagellar biosynthesis protein FliP